MNIIDNLLCKYGYHKDIEFLRNSSLFFIPDRYEIVARCKNCKHVIAEWEVENIDFNITKK